MMPINGLGIIGTLAWHAYVICSIPFPLPAGASLDIEAMSEATEIIVDRSRIELTKEFQGPVTVRVAAIATQEAWITHPYSSPSLPSSHCPSPLARFT